MATPSKPKKRRMIITSDLEDSVDEHELEKQNNSFDVDPSLEAPESSLSEKDEQRKWRQEVKVNKKHNQRLSATFNKLLKKSNEQLQLHANEKMRILKEKNSLAQELDRIKKLLEDSQTEKDKIVSDLNKLKNEMESLKRDNEVFKEECLARLSTAHVLPQTSPQFPSCTTLSPSTIVTSTISLSRIPAIDSTDTSHMSNTTVNELENERRDITFECTWVTHELIEQNYLNLELTMNNKVADLLEEASKMVNFSENGSGKLRLLEVVNYKISSVMREDLPLATLTNKHFTNKLRYVRRLRVEEIPSDEINIADDELLIPVAHYQKEILFTYGVPFLLKVKQKEPFYRIKERIQRKLRVRSEEFKEYDFALIIKGKLQSLPDTYCINLSDFASDSLPGEKRTFSSWLGIDHINKNVRNEGFEPQRITQSKSTYYYSDCISTSDSDLEYVSSTFKCTWVNSKLKEEEKLVLSLKDTDKVHDLLRQVIRTVDLNEDGSGKLRLLEIFNDAIVSIHNENILLKYVTKSTKLQNSFLRVEEIPCNEINMAEDELLLPVAHYRKVFYATFGVPFLIKVKHGEQFSNVKERIKEKLEVSDEEFKKYKFVLVAMPRPQLLRDTDYINLPDFAHRSMNDGKLQTKSWIGIDHYNIDVRELRNKTQFKCTWVNNKLEEEKELVLHLSKINTVADFLEEAKKQLHLSENGSGRLRLIYTVNCKIYSVIREARSYETLDEPKFHTGTLRVQEILGDEIEIARDELLISVGHYQKDVSSTFGVPFLMKVKNGEPFSQVKERIQKKLDVSYKEFKTYKFALIVSETPLPLEDTYCVNTSNFTMPGILTDGKCLLWPWLGIDHVNEHVKKPKYNLRKRKKTN